jgi:hypothetical protein
MQKELFKFPQAQSIPFKALCRAHKCTSNHPSSRVRPDYDSAVISESAMLPAPGHKNRIIERTTAIPDAKALVLKLPGCLCLSIPDDFVKKRQLRH